MAQDFGQIDAQDLRRIDFSHEEDKFFEVFDFYCTTVLSSQAYFGRKIQPCCVASRKVEGTSFKIEA